MSHDVHVHLSDAEVSRLMDYEWPGNVRELKNVIERSLIIQRGQPLRPSLLLRTGVTPAANASAGQDDDEIVPLEDTEKKCISQALKKFNGNYSQSARALGISLSTLKRKVKSYNL